jgi:F-type H+-transporting ATPase subunit c
MDIEVAKVLVKGAALFGAALCMGIGAWGPAIGEGHVAAKAVEGTARQPEAAGILRITMLVGQAVTESTGIYSLVIALLLIFLAGL